MKVAEAVAAQGASWLVVGWPLDPGGGAGGRCRDVSAFLDALRDGGCDTPVLLWDETGTSAAARAALRDEAADAAAGRAAAAGGDPVRARRRAERSHLSPERLARTDAYAAAAILDSVVDAVRHVAR